MNVQAPPARYSSVAIILHWLLAALLLFQVALGWRLEDMTGLPQYAAYQLHKTIGISILLLSVARLAIRIWVPRPRTVNTSLLLAAVAGAVHALFYVVMILGPITGWIIVSTSEIKVPTLFFGVIPWPHLPLGAGWHDPADAIHGLLGWLMIGLVFLHVGGALRHHLMRKDILGRMMPRAMSWGALTGAAAVAIFGAFSAFALGWLLPMGGGSGSGAEPVQADAAMNLSDADEALNAMQLANAAALVGQQNQAAVEGAQEEAATEEVGEKAAPWTVQSGGKLGFRTVYSGASVEGGFSRWDADIMFSPDDLPSSRISVTVDLASVDSADGARDDMLRGDEFFGIATYPRATFRSTRITHQGGNAYRAAGTLSLHGKQNPATLAFTLDITGDNAHARGSTQISRTAYGVGSGDWAATDTIPDGVTINFDFRAKRSK